jgi:hypothetical protein
MWNRLYSWMLGAGVGATIVINVWELPAPLANRVGVLGTAAFYFGFALLIAGFIGAVFEVPAWLRTHKLLPLLREGEHLYASWAPNQWSMTLYEGYQSWASRVSDELPEQIRAHFDRLLYTNRFEEYWDWGGGSIIASNACRDAIRAQVANLDAVVSRLQGGRIRGRSKNA